MFEITPDNALDYLRSTGRIGAGPASAALLGGGVSNLVLRIEADGQRFVLKQSRPQLRTRDAWFSDLNRVYREQEVMQMLGPLLPVGVVPEVLFVDRPNYVFAMSHAPLDALGWKALLLAGEVDFGIGELCGTVLGRMHQATAERRELVEPFRDHTVFVQLRVDPYYRRIQERCPDVAAAVEPLIEQMLTVQDALCHGDFSPKNILVHGDRSLTLRVGLSATWRPDSESQATTITTGGGFMLVDYETAHLGDPTMDLGFFLSHLMLKAVRRSHDREQYFALTRAFWRRYAEEVRFRPVAELMARGIGHLGLCILARIDGTSPVEYLTDELLRERARWLGRKLLLDRPASWDDVLVIAETILCE